MTRGPTRDVAASVHQRLLNKSRETRRPFDELLRYFGMERFLYRLSKSAHADNFVLKGALMFRVWQEATPRPTMDIDLLGKPGIISEMNSIIRDACTQEVEPDGLSFDVKSIRSSAILEETDFEGTRIRFRGFLGKALTPMQIDVSFDESDGFIDLFFVFFSDFDSI